MRFAALVEDRIAKDPHEAFLHKWAVFDQPSLAKVLGVSVSTLYRHISKPPFVARRQQIDGKPELLWLLRLGEAPRDFADEAKRIMIKIWNGSQGRQVTIHEGQILYKMAGDIMKFAAAHKLTTEQGSELMIAAFKYAITAEGWKGVCVYVKLTVEPPKGKEPFYPRPIIAMMNRFWPQTLYAYVQAILPPADTKFPTGWDPGWKGWKVMLKHLDDLSWKESEDAFEAGCWVSGGPPSNLTEPRASIYY